MRICLVRRKTKTCRNGLHRESTPQRHKNWQTFYSSLGPFGVGKRLILATTKGSVSAYNFAYEPEDILMFGSEAAGVPEDIHTTVSHRIRIPMAADARSLNVAMSAGMILAEALRTTNGLPKVQRS